MPVSPAAANLLAQETRALLTRLDRLLPFALVEPMVPAAGLFPNAQSAIERMLFQGRQELRHVLHQYLAWLSGPGRLGSASQAQRRFTLLKLRFQAVLNEFDMFSEAITQRSEHDNGPWLSGLDVVAADALVLPGRYYDLPPLICFLDRGPGAAIRRARTRLPGGHTNPVAIIRVPRERMIGSGIAGSLVHEVGHQAAALDGPGGVAAGGARGLQRGGGAERDLWGIWERWISEIVADFWSVARVGIAATLGLIGVVSLPRPFVFRLNMDDPHPMPWLRVKLSTAMGHALFPHPPMGPVGGAVGRAISTRRTGHGTAYVTAASGSTNVRVRGASGASPAGAAAREFVARSDANPDAHAGTTGCAVTRRGSRIRRRCIGRGQRPYSRHSARHARTSV